MLKTDAALGLRKLPPFTAGALVETTRCPRTNQISNWSEVHGLLKGSSSFGGDRHTTTSRRPRHGPSCISASGTLP